MGSDGAYVAAVRKGGIKKYAIIQNIVEKCRIMPKNVEIAEEYANFA